MPPVPPYRGNCILPLFKRGAEGDTSIEGIP